VPAEPTPRLPAGVILLFRALLPIAERDEVVADLRAEYAQRAAADGSAAARRWAWRQAMGSVPALLRRGWWRGSTGFEPGANRMRPGGPMFESWIIDARYTWRRLWSRPAYAVVAIATLALGAGGTAAVFSVVRALLLEPLPIAREAQVAVFWFDGSWTEQEFLRLRGHFPGFQRVAAYRPDDLTLEIPGSPMRLEQGVAASAELFDVLGAAPMLGTTFHAGDDAPGAAPAAVLSYRLWQQLGSDPQIVGKPLTLGGVSRTVVGVMPRSFWFPTPTTTVWTAAPLDPQNRAGRYTLIGRAADGFDVAHMEAPLQALKGLLAANFNYPAPQWDKTRNPAVTAARTFFVGDVKPALLATLVAMGLILLIACANVAALMLGQLDTRATEIALRAALGANRQRLVQQLVIESILVGAAAGVAGAAFAFAGFRTLTTALPLGALADNATLDWTVFWASMAAALAAAALVAVVPGAALWRSSSLRATMATTRTGGVGTRGGRLEGGLVVAQMALAVLLAAAAGLLIRSVANLRAIDPGMRVDSMAVIDATMPARLPVEQTRQVTARMLDALAALPGAQRVAATQKIPLRGSGDNFGIGIRGKPDLNATTAFRIVSPGYFTTMGIPLVRGRDFEPSDRQSGAAVVVINEALAAKFFPNEDPIGQVLQTFDEAGERIVGIVGNAAEANLTDAAVPARYMLFEHVPLAVSQLTFIIRTDSEAHTGALVAAARATVAAAGTQLAVRETTTMRNTFDAAMGPTAQVVTLLSLLALLAVVLGAVGVYGVISHFVQRRTREYGIRIALGEQPSAVVRHVVARGTWLVLAGSAIGVAAAMAATRLLVSLLYHVRSTDPLTLGAAVSLLVAVGAIAAAVPAWRASRTDPAVVLRQP
jgi:predicted permease